ncbi:glycosyltransferase [Fluviibacter phosphoraccumulans]|uniref:glycosyltransferase n=1 Tax=Fluviibacter phosphoraccumulans TaxID=1751046 RepID=UPI001389BDE2|nr:glycosyltransferase [Fluviibacter phosphoraccumulans]
MNTAANNKKIHILTSFAVREGFDLGPTLKAIESACKMDAVHQIHILSETDKSIAEEAMPFLRNSKVVFATTKGRPSFADLFNYSNQLDLSDDAVVALMNSDVSFATEADIERAVHVLDIARSYGYQAVLAITRHDLVDGKPELALYDTTGLPNCVSCDCWVFRPPLRPINVEYIHLGDMNCDSILAFNFSEAGYCLINPCIDIVIIHHEEIKNDLYYEFLNQKSRSRELLGWHWAKQCNQPYKTYGVPWTSTNAVETGYLPTALLYQKQRIYLALPKKSTDCVLAVAALTEVIARTNECDLVILFDDEEEWESTLADKFGAVSRNVYLISVSSHNAVIDNLISDKNWYGDSCALISRFDYLTNELIQEFNSVIFDARKISASDNVFAPAGHDNLKLFAESRYPEINFMPEVTFSENFTYSDGCTLITSVFKSERFINGFKNNITALNGYESIPHVLLFSACTEHEHAILRNWQSDHSNAILCWFKNDPGLYECWNIGIRISQTEYVSNANVDDLRHPRHVEELVAALRNSPLVAVASTPVVPFYDYVDDIRTIEDSSPWYTDQLGLFRFDDLANLEKRDDGKWKLNPHNLPHCMPVWRKLLHDKYGFFEENKYGTFADWAYWLKVTKHGESGVLLMSPFTYYFVNQYSHNRRGDLLNEYHSRVEDEFLAYFFYRDFQLCNHPLPAIDLSAEKHSNDSDSLSWPKKFQLEGINQSFGQHRNSFNKLIESLVPLHSDTAEIKFIPFIERYFVWGTDDGEAASLNPRPILTDWVGILHVPFDAPKWFEPSVSPESIFSTQLWIKSLEFCKGIICLSEDLGSDLQHWLPKTPVLSVKFPTELSVKKFSYENYISKPRIVQAGDWLRRLQAIYQVVSESHEKIFLMKNHTRIFLDREIEQFGDLRNNSVSVRDMVNNSEYDEILSSSVVLCMLYATAANNIVTECIARNTPIIINPLPSVVEYLGEDYPLYVTSIAEASSALSDFTRIYASHKYLEGLNKTKEMLSYESFLKSIANSPFYSVL